jgi:hypothetical protein
MSTEVFSQSARPSLPVSAGARLTVAVVLAAWFALVLTLGAARAFVTPPGTPPLPIAAGVTAPFVLFLAAYLLSHAFREFVRTLDVRPMLAIQAWRFAGIGFLALYTWGVLPGSFALPAGLGDIAIGTTAPLMLAAVIRRPRFAAGKTFAVWNVLGILDLVVAVTTGALGSALATGVAGEVTTAPMAQLPLVLIPVYFVPILAMLHIAALIQARRLAVLTRAP